jgi:hypothetical protein
VIELILEKLHKVRKSGKNYMACCPSHEDSDPSLSLTQLPDGRILMKCFAGCEVTDILSSIGLSVSDLFPDHGLGNYRSFVNVEKSIKQHKQKPLQHERTILTLAKARRESGERLSSVDLDHELRAYLKIRQCEKNPND